MAWSPYKERIVSFVRANPGCCKLDVARRCTRSQLRTPSKQYYIVNTAIRHGWIRAEKLGNRYSLTVPDRS